VNSKWPIICRVRLNWLASGNYLKKILKLIFRAFTVCTEKLLKFSFVLPSKTVYLTTSLTNLSLILTLLEFKHGKQSALIVAQLIEITVVNY